MSRSGKRIRMAEVVRRRRTPRLDIVSALAVILPLVTVGVLALVRQPPVHDQRQAPELTRLTNATIVCPSAQPGSPDGAIGTASGKSGGVTVSPGGTVSLTPGATSAVPGSGTVVVTGHDALAPGLLGLRSGTSPVSAEECGVPLATQFFTGLGAGATHDSVIELVNPDAGPADADITLYGAQPFTARKLHGITIPAHKTISLDLGAIVPRRIRLSAQVQVTRGRLGVHVLDSRTNLARHRLRREWIPRQVELASDNRLLGLPAGHGSRTLQLANPGTDVVRAQVKVITGDTSFAPAGLSTVNVPAGTTTSVPLTKVLTHAITKAGGKGEAPVGVEVSADGPLAASVLTDLGTDLAVTVPDAEVRAEAATLLPTSSSKASPLTGTLYLSADSAGAANVTAYGASGKHLLHRRVGVQQGHTVAVRLPRGAAFLTVTPQGTTLRSSVVLSGKGASVIPLHELLTQGLVPQIQPASN
jgi:hypothetical protein